MRGPFGASQLAPLGYFASPWLLELVRASPEVRAEALPYLRTMFVCSLGQLLYFMVAGALRAAGDARTGNTVALTYTGGLQGTGDTKGPLYITLVSQIAIPLGLCFYLQATGQLQASGIWLAIVLGHFTRCVLSAARFHQGRWQHIQVDLRH